MNIINVYVNFSDGFVEKSGADIVSGDYFSTRLVFSFDNDYSDSRLIFKMKDPDNNLVYAGEIIDGEILLGNIFEKTGKYPFEVALYENSGRLTSACGRLIVNAENVVIEDSTFEAQLPLFEQLMSEVESINLTAGKSGGDLTVVLTDRFGESETFHIYDGVGITDITLNPDYTLTVTLSDGTSYTTGSIRGEKGAKGDTGEKGDKGDAGADGADGEDGVGIVSIAKTATVGNVDTYTITLSNGETSTFTVTNAVDSAVLYTEQTLSDSQKKTARENINAAAPSGYYAAEGLGAATAENLIDTKAVGTEREFTFDTACGAASITDDGIAEIAEIKGNTEVVNGELVNFNATAIKSVGFNAYHNGVAKLLGGKAYQITGAAEPYYFNGDFITVDSNGIFTPIEDGELNVTADTPETCVHLVWSGYRNGEFEPYWERTVNLPTAQYFPSGMKSTGEVYDSLLPDKAVKRVGELVLNNANIAYRGNYTNLVYAQIILPQESDIRYGKNDFLIAGYPIKVSGNWDDASNIGYALRADGASFFIGYELGTTIEQMKADLVGKAVNYRLANEVVTPIAAPYIWRYKVADFGTEEIISETDTTPIKAIIKYSTDFAREVVNLSENAILKSSAPDANGTYYLKCTVANGVKTFTWA